MKVEKAKSEGQSLTNKVIVNGADISPSQVPHVKISTMTGVTFIMSTLEDNSITPGTIGFGINARKWAALSLGQEVQVEPYRFDLEKHCISTLTVEVDF